MQNESQKIALDLLKTGILVEFDVVNRHTKLSLDKENLYVVIELLITSVEHDNPQDVVEWGGFGFLFVLAAFSFSDARPRAASVIEFERDHEFNVSDFMRHLTFGNRGLTFNADYIRGRCLKTEITIQSDGKVILTTWGRGKTAERWLDTLKGKKRLEVV